MLLTINQLLAQYPVISLLLSTTSVLFGDFFCKAYSLHHAPHMYALAILCYVGSGMFFIPTLFSGNLSYWSPIWQVMTVLGTISVATVIYSEKISPLQCMGIILAIAGIVCIAFGRK